MSASGADADGSPDGVAFTDRPAEMPMPFDLHDGIALLERTPATFRALLAGLSDAWITANEGPETFSAFDNLGHLIHGERTDWIPRARIILDQGENRTF